MPSLSVNRVKSIEKAGLYDRGNGLIYDDVLDITWIQDANYAQTSGFDSDGRLTWGQAKDWAENLEVGSFNEWRLPKKTGPAENLPI